MVYNYIMFDICWHYFNHLVYLKEKKQKKKRKRRFSRLYSLPRTRKESFGSLSISTVLLSEPEPAPEGDGDVALELSFQN